MNDKLTKNKKQSRHNLMPIGAALIVAGLLSACGGGDSQPASQTTTSNSSGNQTGGTPSPGNNSGDTSSGTTATGPTVMACADGADYQCSGEKVVAAGEVALTEFGVQAYGRSTSDLVGFVDASNATGFRVENSGGVTEVRVAKNSNGVVSRVAVLLSQLGLSWDDVKERPKIIEGFDPTQGRVTVEGGKLKFDNPLRPSSDTNFYDFATVGTSGTQVNYAYNRYFPRSGDNPPRCPAGSESWCTGKETDGPQSTPGDWRTGGNQPDTVNATRFHEDGDVHAGDALNGSWLEGGSGHGVPFAGSKGFRTYNGLSYQYANLGAWFTADTVLIAEWTGKDGGREHSTNRRGVVAFGALTNPTTLPTTGSATYTGKIYGRYSASKDADPSTFEGTATVSVNFAKHEATITIQPDNGAIPVGFTATTSFGTGSGNLANSVSGAVNNGKLTGNVTGRYFGPVITTGSSGQGPAETGGAFALKNASTGEAVVGGFIARKQ